MPSGAQSGACATLSAATNSILPPALIPAALACWMVPLQAWRSFLRGRSGGLPPDAALLDSLEERKAFVPRVLVLLAVVLPTVAMRASGGGLGMSMAAAGLSLAALAHAPLPRQASAWPEARQGLIADTDRRALEEAAAAPLVWWPGLPGWAAVALLLATCWHAIDLMTDLLPLSS